MKILIVNNYYYRHGGVETAVFNSAKILEQHGHKIIFFCSQHPNNYGSEFSEYFVPFCYNLSTRNIIKRGLAAINSIYSIKSRKYINKLISKYKPDIAYIHDVQWNISPSVIDEIKKHDIPIVLNLHSPKLVCVGNALFNFNTKQICEKCRNRKYHNAITSRCVDGTLIVGIAKFLEMFVHHYLLRIFDKVDLFVAPSFFLIDKLKDMGFDREIMHLSYPFLIGEYSPRNDLVDKSIIYFGRLAPEKGIEILIEAVQDLNIKLKIVGSGQLFKELHKQILLNKITNIEIKGPMFNEKLKREISSSLFSVLPSVCYETFPYTILESFALGRPVIASAIGGIPEAVFDHETGLLFKPGDVKDLRSKVSYLTNHASLIREMGNKARVWLEENFSPDKWYKSTIEIYNRAMGKRS